MLLLYHVWPSSSLVSLLLCSIWSSLSTFLLGVTFFFYFTLLSGTPCLPYMLIEPEPALPAFLLDLNFPAFALTLFDPTFCFTSIYGGPLCSNWNSLVFALCYLACHFCFTTWFNLVFLPLHVIWPALPASLLPKSQNFGVHFKDRLYV